MASSDDSTIATARELGARLLEGGNIVSVSTTRPASPSHLSSARGTAESAESGSAAFVRCLRLDGHAVAQDALDVAITWGTTIHAWKVRSGRPRSWGSHALLRDARGELADRQLPIEKHRGDFGAVQQMLDVVVELLQLDVSLLIPR